jgi:hypothetical protein
VHEIETACVRKQTSGFIDGFFWGTRTLHTARNSQARRVTHTQETRRIKLV